MAAFVESLLFAGVVDTHNRGVSHPGGRLRLLAELALKLRVVGEIGLEQLHRDGASEPGVDTLVNFCHAAATNQCAEAVSACNQSFVFAHVISLYPCPSLVFALRNLVIVMEPFRSESALAPKYRSEWG